MTPAGKWIPRAGSSGFALVLGLALAACGNVAPTASPSSPAGVDASAAAVDASPSPLGASPSPVGASPSPAGSPSLAATGSFFAVSVADLRASTAWYTDKLGFHSAMLIPPANGVSVVLLDGDGLTVELIHQDDGVSLDKIDPTIKDRTLLHGIVKAGVIVDDLDATVAWLRARNVPIAFGPFPATLEQPANLIIADNEGNLIQFIARKRA